MKYYIQCTKCSNRIKNFDAWYKQGQACNECGSSFADVNYISIKKNLEAAIEARKPKLKGIYRYFDILPVENELNCITAGENDVSIDRWLFLEKYALKFGVNVNVFAHRHDNNPATGTFKDLAGAMVASVLKEIGIKYYAVASTGNIGVALSRYLSEANISLHVFLPENASSLQDAEISCFGQKVFRVKGGYTEAKKLCSVFSKKKNIPISPNLYDPIRIEAKKTISYEWRRQLVEFPNVYIQALSGGTGPLGIAKGCREMMDAGLIDQLPRFLLVQSKQCDPMSQAWKAAKDTNFPPNWLNSYPIIDNPVTNIPTLATGSPHLYPNVAKLVRATNGEIFSLSESLVPHIARLTAFEVAVRMGPAAAIAVGGFFKALHKGYLRDGDNVLITIGEGIRRSPEFMETLKYTSEEVTNLEQCRLIDRKSHKSLLWDNVIKYLR